MGCFRCTAQFITPRAASERATLRVGQRAPQRLRGLREGQGYTLLHYHATARPRPPANKASHQALTALKCRWKTAARTRTCRGWHVSTRRTPPCPRSSPPPSAWPALCSTRVQHKRRRPQPVRCARCAPAGCMPQPATATTPALTHAVHGRCGAVVEVRLRTSRGAAHCASRLRSNCYARTLGPVRARGAGRRACGQAGRRAGGQAGGGCEYGACTPSGPLSVLFLCLASGRGSKKNSTFNGEFHRFFCAISLSPFPCFCM
jgi:hypothetical protein